MKLFDKIFNMVDKITEDPRMGPAEKSLFQMASLIAIGVVFIAVVYVAIIIIVLVF